MNNAAWQQTYEFILDISTEQFDWTMKTNLYAPFWIIKAALPHLPPGSVIRTSCLIKNLPEPSRLRQIRF